MDIRVGHGLDDQALIRFAGSERDAAVSAPRYELLAVQPQTGHLLLGAMAGVALLDEEGTDLILVELNSGGIRRLPPSLGEPKKGS